MAKVIRIATIQVAVEADSEAEAADYISETLSGQFFDWEYLKVGGQYLYATERIISEQVGKYEEGDCFR